MAQFRRYLNLGLLLAAPFLATAFAASPTVSKTPSIQVSAVWLRGQSGAADRELFVAVGDAPPVPLAVGMGSRGRPADIKAGATLRLLAKADLPPPAKPQAGAASANAGASNAAASKPSFVPVGEVPWPAGAGRKALLILAAPKDAGGSLRAMALNDDEEVFPANNVRVVNLTSASLMLRFGQAVKPLPPGPLAPLPYGVKADAPGKDPADIPFALAAGDQVFFNGFIDPKPQTRVLVLVVPPHSGGKTPFVQMVRERMPPPPGAAPGNRPPPRS